MAGVHPDTVQRGLQLKKVGNEIVRLLGGREVHPINVRVGGFYTVPPQRAWTPLVERLKWAREAALETVRWTAGLPFPDFEQDYEFVALRHPDEYPFNEGRLVSSKGLDIPIRNYDAYFVEEHVPYTSALHSTIQGSGNYLVGPLARYSLNFDKLSPLAQEAAGEAGLAPLCRNPFQSIVVRSIEMLYACDEALRILADYPLPDQPAIKVEPRAATGYGCTEAPRGILYHRYTLDEQGIIRNAKIVPPTSQNQKTIERDLGHFIPPRVALPKEKLTWQCEQAIRNYDPCISCAVHFLKLKIEEA
jgi:coenzyme F420-reducing hydrogenase alpha subunit